MIKEIVDVGGDREVIRQIIPAADAPEIIRRYVSLGVGLQKLIRPGPAEKGRQLVMVVAEGGHSPVLRLATTDAAGMGTDRAEFVRINPGDERSDPKIPGEADIGQVVAPADIVVDTLDLAVSGNVRARLVDEVDVTVGAAGREQAVCSRASRSRAGVDDVADAAERYAILQVEEEGVD